MVASTRPGLHLYQQVDTNKHFYGMLDGCTGDIELFSQSGLVYFKWAILVTDILFKPVPEENLDAGKLFNYAWFFIVSQKIALTYLKNNGETLE